MHRVPLILLFLSVMLCTCLKPPSYSDIPAITFQSVYHDTVHYISGGSADIDTISITFTDGNGNLGTNTQADSNIDSQVCQSLGIDSSFNYACAHYPSAYDLFALDSRAGKSNQHCFVLYQIPVIPQQGSSRAISGTITFQTYLLTPVNNSTTDSLSYFIMVRDNAGNCSNIVRTSTIYIVP